MIYELALTYNKISKAYTKEDWDLRCLEMLKKVAEAVKAGDNDIEDIIVTYDGKLFNLLIRTSSSGDKADSLMRKLGKAILNQPNKEFVDYVKKRVKISLTTIASGIYSLGD